ncbi:MAG: hypothetical protein J5659_07155 [Clostridia bacterium]|nr:hypothetical protein [Clostridia bacterium]
MRYTKIVDIRDLDIYKNPNIRLVYLHLCLMADSRTNEVVISRSLACDRIGVTAAAYRNALDQLVKCNLIEYVKQPNNSLTSDQGATKGATKQTTKLRLLFTNKLDPISNQASNQGYDQGSNQGYNQSCDHIINKNNIQKTSFSLSAHAREVIFASVDAVAIYCGLSAYQAEQYCKAFCNAMTRKKKSWLDDEDLTAHLLDWSYKHLQGAKNLIVNNTTEKVVESQEAPKEARKMTNEEGWAKFRAMLEEGARNGDERAKKELEKRGWL